MTRIIKISVVILLLCLSGCSSKDLDYISFTFSYHNEEVDKPYTEVYSYALNGNKNEPTLITTFEHTSKYPLTFYNKNNNRVYYSASDGQGSDQLFVKNPETEEVTQLTTNLYAINYILPIKDNDLFLVAVDQQSTTVAMQPFIYSVEEKSLKKLEWDPDLDIRVVDYLNGKGLVFGARSYQETKNKIINQDITPITPTSTTLFRYDFSTGEIELIQKLDNIEVVYLYTEGDNIYIKDDNLYVDDDKTDYCYSLKDKKLELIEKSNASDRFILGAYDGTEYSIEKESIIAIDEKTSEKRIIFEPSYTASTINNVLLVPNLK